MTAVLERPPSGAVDGASPAGQERREGKVAAVLAGPAIAGVSLFVIVPTMLSVVASFFSIPLSGQGWRWVGLANFRFLFTDHDVLQAMRNTLVYCAMTIIPSIVIGLTLALLVESVRHGKGVLRSLLFLPITANLVAMAVVFNFIFASQGGVANSFLADLGLGRVNFLGSTHDALGTIALIGIWRSASFAMIFFIGGLTTIPTTVHEACLSDGVRGMVKVRRVVIPLLKPTTLFVTIITVLSSVQVFDTINVLTQGGPLGSSQTILTEAWTIGFSDFEIGRASALTCLVLVVLIGLGVLRRRALAGEES
jgi:multiple sugar transport system permease protein